LLGARPLSKSALVPPRPQPLKAPLSGLRVTQFRDYIACPYRFYLRNVVGLEPLADAADELDGGAFGDLVHLVLEQFGRAADSAELRASTNPKAIAEYLEEKLDRFAAARFGGRHARAAVYVQIEQARLRLRAFAQWQARRSGDGWRIVFSEDSEQQRTLTAAFPAGAEPFTLRGRIDRIDYHDQFKVLSVLDYKTGDAGLAPERAHRRAGAWIDLQLPLYRHLIGSAGLGLKLESLAIELGYILLPKDSGGVVLARADWDRLMLESADELARQIIADIRAEKFWPPTSPPPDFADDLATICQDRSLGSWRAGAAGDAA
jgi:hypothetical protein